MKLLLDTTYLLPSIKVQVQGLPPTVLKDLLHNAQIEIYFSEISLFELTAKGMKLICSGDPLNVSDLRIGIDSLQYNPRVKSLPWSMHPFLLDLALRLRRIHSDFIDCLILSTAVFYADCFATYDATLYDKITKNSDICKEIAKGNNNFQFWFFDLKNPPRPIVPKN
jgi:predicted nucleic acid-binding protein